MRALLLVTAALALSACGTTPNSSTYAAENHAVCGMSSPRENAACVHAAGAKRSVAKDVAVAK